MEKINIILDGKNIGIYVKIKKIKNIYFQIKDNNIILKLPKKLNLKQLNLLIEKNKNWILKEYNKIKVVEDNIFIFLSEKYNIKFIENSDFKYKIIENDKIVYISNKIKEELISIENIKNYVLKEEAIIRLQTIFYEMVLYTGLKPDGLVIKNLKSCWRKL